MNKILILGGFGFLGKNLNDTFKNTNYTIFNESRRTGCDLLNYESFLSKLENISPSLEPSHAFAEAIKLAPRLSSSEIIIVNSCGDSLKDKDIIKHKLGSYIR